MSDLHLIRLDVLTLDQAAEVLHISTTSVKKLIRLGELAPFRLRGIDKVFVTPEAIADYIERCKRDGEADAAALRAQEPERPIRREAGGSPEFQAALAGLRKRQ